MKKLIIFTTVSLILISNTIAVSNKSSRTKKKQLIELADSAFFAEDFTRSLDLYDQILRDFPSNHYVQYHRYVAYHLSKGRGTDVDLIYEYEQNEGHVDKFYNYWLGRIHYERYEFDVARDHFMAFLNLNAFRSAEIKKETETYLKNIDKALRFHSNPDDYQIIPLGNSINSEYADVSPAFFGNHSELLFLSSRPESGTTNGTNKKFRVFHTQKENKQWNVPSSIDRLGTFSDDNAKIEVVNQDGKLFMFLDKKNGGLHYSEPIENTWTSPLKFDAKIDGKTIDAHFFINDDENVIYFSAVQEKNRLDILESHFDNERQSWSTPKPLKGEINSRYDDDSPFLSHDGRYMYFSSNRRASVGGFDIFRSEYDATTDSWSKAENVGFPINTIDDEINFQLNEDNISGFISSNRLHSKGDYDIYYFHKTKKVLASGTITDKNSGNPIQNVLVEFLPVEYTDESFKSYTDSNGSFSTEVFENQEFIVQLSLNNETLFANKVTSISGDLHRSFVTDFTVDLTTMSNTKTDFMALYQGKDQDSEYATIEMLGNKFRAGQKAVLKNIYFDFRSYQLKPEASETIEQIFSFLQASPVVRIEVSGHTDNIGSAQSNKQISLKRAQSIKRELVRMGISPDRLMTQGYGETQPLASNDDEENGRELNRRIEVRILD